GQPEVTATRNMEHLDTATICNSLSLRQQRGERAGERGKPQLAKCLLSPALSSSEEERGQAGCVFIQCQDAPAVSACPQPQPQPAQTPTLSGLKNANDGNFDDPSQGL